MQGSITRFRFPPERPNSRSEDATARPHEDLLRESRPGGACGGAEGGLSPPAQTVRALKLRHFSGGSPARAMISNWLNTKAISQ